MRIQGCGKEARWTLIKTRSTVIKKLEPPGRPLAQAQVDGNKNWRDGNKNWRDGNKNWRDSYKKTGADPARDGAKTVGRPVFFRDSLLYFPENGPYPRPFNSDQCGNMVYGRYAVKSSSLYERAFLCLRAREFDLQFAVASE